DTVHFTVSCESNAKNARLPFRNRSFFALCLTYLTDSSQYVSQKVDHSNACQSLCTMRLQPQRIQEGRAAHQVLWALLRSSQNELQHSLVILFVESSDIDESCFCQERHP